MTSLEITVPAAAPATPNSAAGTTAAPFSPQVATSAAPPTTDSVAALPEDLCAPQATDRAAALPDHLPAAAAPIYLRHDKCRAVVERRQCKNRGNSDVQIGRSSFKLCSAVHVKGYSKGTLTVVYNEDGSEVRVATLVAAQLAASASAPFGVSPNENKEESTA